MDLTALETTEIISLYGSVIKELKARGVIRTNNLLCRPHQHRKH